MERNHQIDKPKPAANRKLINIYLRPSNYYMVQSNIIIDVELDNDRVPSNIKWHASESSANEPQNAKAMMLSFWDGADKSALRIDLWTQKMMVDEMADFYYQTMMTMADTFERATKQTELVDDMKKFAKAFHAKFQAIQMKENKA